MEFKVFKNENSKILKEYWLTQSEWDALDKTTVQEGDIYHIVGTIDKGDLSADVNASLAKADSSLQKPTTTLAKESFVKVGIDGTQKFDDTVYATADSAKILEAKLNENIVKDPSKTYLVWKGNKFPNSTDATFKAPAGCTIDWGDGTVETFSTASTTVNTHTYTDGIEYHLISLSNYTVIDNAAFYNCSGLTNVIIGTSVTSIKGRAFYNCSGLTSITIPNSVTIIFIGAFGGCSGLTSVTIPDSVTAIDIGVFSGCSGLKTVKISAINPPTLGSNAFDTSIEKIIVPKSAINAYKSAAGWSTYADKIVYEIDSSDFPEVMTSPFITGQYYLPSGESLTILDNKLYIIQCLDEKGNIDTFTVHGSGKSVDGKFALIISGGPVPPHPGPHLSTSLAIVQTGSIVLSELAKTAVAITTVSPKSSKSKIYYYMIDGTLEAFKGDKGDTSGGGKCYMHDVTIRNNSGVKLPIVKFKYISTDNTTFSLDKFNFYKCFDVYASKNSTPPEFHGVQAITINASSISIMYYTKYPFSVTGTAQLSVQIADTEINDNIYEL